MIGPRRIEHGSISCYWRDACRCVACKQAQREYSRDLRQRRKNGEPPARVTGKRVKLACGHCGKRFTTTWGRVNRNVKRSRARNGMYCSGQCSARSQNGRRAKHGGGGQYNWHGCRCAECVAWNRDRHAKQRATEKEKR